METTEIIKALPTLSIDERLSIATIALNSIGVLPLKVIVPITDWKESFRSGLVMLI
jgi:hypothetical protein